MSRRAARSRRDIELSEVLWDTNRVSGGSSLRWIAAARCICPGGFERRASTGWFVCDSDVVVNGRRIILLLSTGALLAAVVAVALAPLLLGPDYDPIRRSISESAAQQTSGAWLGRLGLFLSGLGVLGVTLLRAPVWHVVPTVTIALFGTFWMLTAVFSTASWRPEAAVESSESVLHSVLASAMAVIVVGTLVIGLRRAKDGYPTPAWRTATLLFAAAATFLPRSGDLPRHRRAVPAVDVPDRLPVVLGGVAN